MRVVVTILLMLAAVPTWAEWVKVTENDAAATYVDLATLSKNGSFRRVRMLDDYKWSRGDNATSTASLVDYDCELRRTRTLSLTSYSGPMATGKVIDEGLARGDWKRVFSATAAEGVLEFICAQ